MKFLKSHATTETMESIQEYRTPGQLIAALIKERGWTQTTLGIVLGMEKTAVSRLVKGARPMTAELALVLGDLFEVPARKFIDLQASYDLARAEIEFIPDPSLAARARLFGGLPIADMLKRGWIQADGVTDLARVESEVLRFFGAKSVDEISAIPHSAKRAHVSSGATPSQLTWLYRVKSIASEMLVGQFSDESARQAVMRLEALLLSAAEVRKVPRILAECGIRFVIVESLPGAKIDGVCLWLEDGKQPVIGMSLRYDRLDNFWFVLRHELEHVRLRHGVASPMLDAELEGARAGTGDGVHEEERAANAAAANFCVPQAKLARFIQRKSPFFSERDLIGFARTTNVHPGLVAGQLQRHLNRYDLFRKHQVKVRSVVSPGSMVDGWGDVAPLGG